MPRNLKSFVRDQRGASMPEYALLLFAVLISAAAAAKRVGPRVSIAGDVTRRLLAGEDVTVDGAGGGALGGMAASVPGSSAGGGPSGSGAAASGGGGNNDNASNAGSTGGFGGSSAGGGGGAGSIGSSGSSSGLGGGGGGGGVLNGGGVVLGATGSQSINGTGSDFGAASNAGSSSGGLAIGPQSTDGLGASSNASTAMANNFFGSSAPAKASSSNALPQGFLGGSGAPNPAGASGSSGSSGSSASAQNTVNPAPPSSSTEPGVTGDGYAISANGEKEMQTLLAQAKTNADGKRPLGYCYRQVKEDIAEVGYGDIAKQGNTSQLKPLPGADQEYAHDFADYMNAKAVNGHTNADNLGLQKLPITNPYDAPPGSIIVVRAGTPGTRNPVAGDIVVAGGGGKFYNDGNMGYGGSKNFPAGNNYVLGIYAPK